MTGEMQISPFIVAIDGPAGSGKTTTARAVARHLGFLYVDTGAMYRAVALAALRLGLTPRDEDRIQSLVSDIDVSLRIEGGNQITLLNGESVDALIRSQEVSKAASDFSAVPSVRDAMVRLQRRVVEGQEGAVLEGRDIGTVVFPNAPCKIYLIADIETRARRRVRQLQELGMDADLDAVRKDITDRDANDSSRAHAPLRKSSDAIEVETTNTSIEEQVRMILALITPRYRKFRALPRIEVRIDPTAGFCWGVVRTIAIAEEELREGDPLVSLGDIIHNPQEVERMQHRGMKTIQHVELENLPDGSKVLIRAHGEPPSTYRIARERGIELIDATCPVVTKLQERVRKFYDEGYQVVIFGKKDHAEVVGLRGVCHDDCLVVKSLDEAASTITLDRPTVLFSQTTMDKPTFHAIREFLEGRIRDLVVESMEEIATEFHAKDTICGQVSGRDQKLRAFAASCDVMLFVAGRKSSNGKVLFEICHDANPRSYFLEDVSELNWQWLEGATRVGISGATSTPQWHMEQLRDAIIAHVATKDNRPDADNEDS